MIFVYMIIFDLLDKNFANASSNITLLIYMLIFVAIYKVFSSLIKKNYPNFEEEK